MKIQLQNVLYYPSTGGIESFIYNVSKILKETGHEPMILSSKHNKTLSTNDSFGNIEILRHPYYKIRLFPLNILSPIYFVKRLEKYLDNGLFDCDSVWSNFFLDAFASNKTFRKKIPIIYINHAIASNLIKLYSTYSNASVFVRFYVKQLRPQYYLIEKQAINESDKVVTLSKMRKQEICNLYGLEPKRVNVIPPGVDNKKFFPSKKDINLLKEFKIPKDCKIILTIGRLSHEKNLEMLINAFKKIDKKDIFLVIVGDGPERKYLENIVNILNLNKKVIFTGLRNDVLRFYQTADLFVHTSKYEGFGLVYLEAMACKLPCIGLKPDYPNTIVASDEIIDDGNTGLLADSHSVDDLSEKISKLIDDEQFRIRLGNNSRKICEKKFSWEKTVKSLLNLSNSI